MHFAVSANLTFAINAMAYKNIKNSKQLVCGDLEKNCLVKAS